MYWWIVFVRWCCGIFYIKVIIESMNEGSWEGCGIFSDSGGICYCEGEVFIWGNLWGDVYWKV